jgi:hypothetical protein
MNPNSNKLEPFLLFSLSPWLRMAGGSKTEVIIEDMGLFFKFA